MSLYSSVVQIAINQKNAALPAGAWRAARWEQTACQPAHSLTATFSLCPPKKAAQACEGEGGEWIGTKCQMCRQPMPGGCRFQHTASPRPVPASPAGFIPNVECAPRAPKESRPKGDQPASETNIERLEGSCLGPLPGEWTVADPGDPSLSCRWNRQKGRLSGTSRSNRLAACGARLAPPPRAAAPW